MGTSTDVLRIARNELGNTSGKKYWDAFFKGDMSYVDGATTPYCACFVSWVFAQAATYVSGLPAAYCPYICRDGEKSGRIVGKRSALPGDIVLFDWNGDGLSDHIGIVESNQGDYLQTIEGNTKGGIVARRSRDFSTICHVIRPVYDSTEVKGQAIEEKLDVDGWAGPLTIAALQLALHVPSYYVDGYLSGQRVADKPYLENVWSCEWDGLGSYTVEKLQEAIGDQWSQSGCWGYWTSVYFQYYLINLGYSCGEAGADGYFGHDSCCALQRALNDGKLFA